VPPITRMWLTDESHVLIIRASVSLILMWRGVLLMALGASLFVSATASAASIQPVSPVDGAVVTQNPPSTFRWTLDPGQESCGAVITAANPQSPWQNAHDAGPYQGWTMSLNADGVSATLDNQDPLVWGLYHWTVYSAAADGSDGDCNYDGTGPTSASWSFTYGPQLDVSALDNYTAATQLRLLSVYYPTVTMTGAQAAPNALGSCPIRPSDQAWVCDRPVDVSWRRCSRRVLHSAGSIQPGHQSRAAV